MTLHFDCVFYFTTDLRASIAFYSEVLGLRLLSVDSVARFDLDGILVELVPLPPDEPLAGIGNARLCLKTPNLRQTVEQLRGRGASVSEPTEVADGFLANVLDPDGNEICLFQYRK